MMKLEFKILLIILLVYLQSCDDDNDKRQFCGTDFNGFPDIPGWQFTILNTPPTYEPLYFSHFINENIGFIFRKDGIWKTANQGQNWDKVFNGSGLLFHDVSFADSLHWFAAVSDNKKSFILKTNNGGETWSTQDAWRYLLKNITFIDSLNGFGVSSDIFYESKDGGKTWKPNGLSITGSTIIDIGENRIGYYNGFKSSFYLTIDDGASWESIQSPIEPRNIQIVDQNIFIISDGEKLFKTIDGGTSWVDITKFSLRNFYFINANEALSFQSLYEELDYDVLYDCSAFLTTIDGGVNWIQGPISHSIIVRSIQMINPNLGFIRAVSPFSIVKIER